MLFVCYDKSEVFIRNVITEQRMSPDDEIDISVFQIAFYASFYRCGGRSREQFDPQTLESSRTPGLYCVGEALDIDGRCGGYNLHWAFASGLAAGRSAAE